MTISTVCNTCFRDLSDIVYQNLVRKDNLAHILIMSDIGKHGRDCCLMFLYNRKEHIYLHTQLMKPSERSNK